MSYRARTIIVGVLFAAFAVPAAAQQCLPLAGKYDSLPAGTGCASPVGFCTEGSLRGMPSGSYHFSMNTQAPVGESGAESLVFYTGTSVIDALGGRLYGVDAGTLNLDYLGDGEQAALIRITGGTGTYEGAAGYLQLTGNLDFTTGGAEGIYRGKVCLPE